MTVRIVPDHFGTIGAALAAMGAADELQIRAGIYTPAAPGPVTGTGTVS